MYYTKNPQWFRKIEGTELILGKKYLVDGMFRGKYSYFIRFGPQIFRYFELTPFYTHEYSDSHLFHEWIPTNAQEKMERRVVTLIIRRILGDPYFEW
jgi:hypothetical protein